VTAYFVAGADIGKFTIKSIDDDRTLNKTIHFRPSSNMLNINELASLWEDKIGRKLPRITISEDDLLVAAKGMCIIYKYPMFSLS
jgi:leucoanthocyanidin reductase